MRTSVRLGSLLVVVALLVSSGLLVTPAVPADAVGAYTSEELAVFSLINEYRESNGLVSLLLSDTISDACTKHNLDMGRYGFPPNPPGGISGHTTQASDYFPPGSLPPDRMRICGYDYNTYKGEIIGYGYTSAQTVFEAWQNSSGHNAEMLRAEYLVAGVSMEEVPGSPWTYYWTIDFGGYIDPSAHEPGASPSTTTTTTAPTTTTTTTAPTTTTTAPPPPPPSTTTTTTAPPPPPQFTDVPASHRFYREITALAAASVIGGFADHAFRPDDQVTRAQFAKIIVLVIGRHTEQVEGLEHPVFRDVAYTGQPYPFDFVQEAEALGIIKGNADGTFGPYRNLIRTQLALMLVRAGGVALAPPPADFTLPFTDVPAYAKEAVAVAFYNQLLSGKTDTLFGPYLVATRGQVARMVYQLMERLHS